MDVLLELRLLLGLLFSGLLYFLPLNLFLTGGRLKKALSLLPMALGFALISWILYRSLERVALQTNHVGLLITLLVVVNFLTFRMSVQRSWVAENGMLENRVPGWFLFSPLLMVAVIITGPLLAALLSALFH